MCQIITTDYVKYDVYQSVCPNGCEFNKHELTAYVCPVCGNHLVHPLEFDPQW